MILRRQNLATWAILFAALCIAFVGARSDAVRIAENENRAFTAQLAEKPASRQIHIVEIDAKSVSASARWPWTRDHYARLIRELDKAGVRSVVFDIDFSSPSIQEGDAEFAQAIADVDAAIVMPTFSQAASEGSRQRIDALPIAIFRENTSLASASVRPDRDARVRRMVYGTITDGVPRPSISSQIAGADGRVDTAFPIDFSIAPDTIPRHSFAEVENGSLEPGELAGKDIIVGATAIELGDRYGVPIHGVIPGVTIQALAAETLIAGVPAEWGLLPLLLATLMIGGWCMSCTNYKWLAVGFGGGAIGLFAAQAAAYHGASIFLDFIPALIALALICAAQGVRIAGNRLAERSRVDAESGLPNALSFAQCDHEATVFTATAYIKDFDAIQAVLGKAQIGKLIRRVSDRLQSFTDTPTVYRPDARMLSWSHAGDDRELIEQFEALEKAMLKPIEIEGRRFDVALAFGIASGPDLASASRAASAAAKENNLWHAHEDAEAAILEQRVSLMGELDEAIDKEQLRVVYQPKLCIDSGDIESVEALVRWEHPERGFLRPDLFIPLAEETNRIERLTLFVLKRTITDLRQWCETGQTISAAVNISAKLISSEGFVAASEQLLRETGVPRERIIFEVTESAAMRDPELAVKNLLRFRDLGVSISMDDYGTGQSTLSYLQLLPLTELKIDRAFVQNAHVQRSDALLVHSTIQLAHSLGLRVVGEGIEEKECLDFLRDAGCDYAQGYFISKPLSAQDLAAMLAEGTKTPAEPAFVK